MLTGQQVVAPAAKVLIAITGQSVVLVDQVKVGPA
jgi:hypothetical protein